jgi:hypothetical protein
VQPAALQQSQYWLHWHAGRHHWICDDEHENHEQLQPRVLVPCRHSQVLPALSVHPPH